MNIFLSASIPLPDRHGGYYETADVVAIRDAVKAFIQISAPNNHIIFGGHPAITPLFSLLMKRDTNITSNCITLYQSEFFRGQFPDENFDFIDKVYTHAVENDREKSLELMRERMLTDQPISYGVFIGGMNGVEDEYAALRRIQPNAVCLPIASTGGAAMNIFQEGDFDESLKTQLTYRTLFRRIIG